MTAGEYQDAAGRYGDDLTALWVARSMAIRHPRGPHRRRRTDRHVEPTYSHQCRCVIPMDATAANRHTPWLVTMCGRCQLPIAKRYTTAGQTEWQRQYRDRKTARGECAENGCHNTTDGYRCADCRERHAIRERRRA